MLYREMEQKVREAFEKYYEKNKPSKKEKEVNNTGMPPVVCGCGIDVAPDYVIYRDEKKTYKLYYDGGPEDPQFDPLSEAEEVVSKQEYVPVKESEKEDEPEETEVEEKTEMSDVELRDEANAMLRKMGQDQLADDEDVPGWLIRKIEENGKRVKPSMKAGEEKGVYSA